MHSNTRRRVRPFEALSRINTAVSIRKPSVPSKPPAAKSRHPMTSPAAPQCGSFDPRGGDGDDGGGGSASGPAPCGSHRDSGDVGSDGGSDGGDGGMTPRSQPAPQMPPGCGGLDPDAPRRHPRATTPRGGAGGSGAGGGGVTRVAGVLLCGRQRKRPRAAGDPIGRHPRQRRLDRAIWCGAVGITAVEAGGSGAASGGGCLAEVTGGALGGRPRRQPRAAGDASGHHPR